MRGKIPIGVLFCVVVLTHCSRSKVSQGEATATKERPSAEFLAGQYFGLKKLIVSADTMICISDGNLTWRLFGVEMNYDSIKLRLPGDFTSSDSLDFRQITNKKSSIIFRSLDGATEFHSALIADSSVEMFRGLKIGVSKQIFFSKLFKEPNQVDYTFVKIFVNGDPLGFFVDETFVFENDTLSKVIVKRL